MFKRYNERAAHRNAACLEQAVQRDFWFSNALDRLRQPRGRTNEEPANEASAPEPDVSPPPLPSKPKPIPTPVQIQD